MRDLMTEQEWEQYVTPVRDARTLIWPELLLVTAMLVVVVLL